MGCDGAASNAGNFSDTIDLPAGATITYTVNAQVAPTASGALVNTVAVSTPAGTTDPTPDNNSATDTDTLTPMADLAVQKNGQGTVAPNGSVTYTIRVSNAGPSAANGAAVIDTLPAGLTLATWTCGTEVGGATCGTSAGTGNINTSVGLFPPGGSVTFTVAATAPSSGVFVNTATVAPPNGITDPNLTNNASSVTTGVGEVSATADLAVIKSGPSTVSPGAAVTYQIVVTNVGPASANGAVVTDTVPLTSVTWTCGGETAGASCGTANGAGSINTTISTLPVGASVTFTVMGTAPASGSVINTVTAAPPAGVTDPYLANNTSTVSTTIQTPSSTADVYAIKTGPATVLPNGSQSYKVIVGNSGPSGVTNASFKDDVPAFLTGVTWTCGAETGGASCGTAAGGGNAIMTTIANLPVNSTVLFTINATVPANGQWVNSATITPPVGTTDGDPTNNIAGPVITNLIVEADLAVTKSDGSGTYTPGGATTYMIVVTNNGPDGVTGAKIVDNIPAGVTTWAWACSGATGGASGCDGAASNAMNFSDTVDLPSGATITYTVTAQTAPGATANVVNTVTVSAPAGVIDGTPDNNSATDTDSAQPVANLGILKSVTPGVVLPGDTVNYTIVVSNAGPSTALNATVNDPFPIQLVNPTWTCTASAGSSCNAGGGAGEISTTVSLLPGGTATFAVTAKVSLDAVQGTISNTATVAPPDGVIDPAPGDNTSTATNTIGKTPAGVGPGTTLPPGSEMSDQKAGSILIYPIYTSNPVNRSLQDTRLSITNIDAQRSIMVHLFFVDGTACSIADTFVCLTPSQTASFLASDMDPGSTGYMVAVAVDPRGCPALCNQLIGDEYVKLASGHFASLGAEAISGLAGLENNPACAGGASTTATLRFDGVSYNRLPTTLSLDSVPSRVDGNDTMLILDRIGGNFTSGALPLGTIFGVLYDDLESAHSFILPAGSCQLKRSLTNEFPRVVPRFEELVPAGHTGWMRMWLSDTAAMVGATINYNPSYSTSGQAFNEGHNLNKLTLTDSATLIIPVFPPRC